MGQVSDFFKCFFETRSRESRYDWGTPATFEGGESIMCSMSSTRRVRRASFPASTEVRLELVSIVRTDRYKGLESRNSEVLS